MRVCHRSRLIALSCYQLLKLLAEKKATFTQIIGILYIISIFGPSNVNALISLESAPLVSIGFEV